MDHTGNTGTLDLGVIPDVMDPDMTHDCGAVWHTLDLWERFLYLDTITTR